MADGQGSMENLDLTALRLFGGVYQNCRVLVTGHTGFKGSWLSLWLSALGAQVTGLALPPETAQDHWNLLKLPITNITVDIRDRAAVNKAFQEARPDLVIHMAAQSLVRRSYTQSLETWDTNLMGTVNVLEACRDLSGLRGILVVTSDKCYANRETDNGYREDDPLGGHDPYSASKAAADIAASSYRSSFFSTPGAPLLATARAGNVIGGGDWARDRLIADVARAQSEGATLKIRNPQAVRPWQHVLEPLSAYLMLGQGLLKNDQRYARAWNIGPPAHESMSVSDLLKAIEKFWPGLAWETSSDSSMQETKKLTLDSAKISKELGWQAVLDQSEQIKMTAEWYQSYSVNRKIMSCDQLLLYCQNAQKRGAVWAHA